MLARCPLTVVDLGQIQSTERVRASAIHRQLTALTAELPADRPEWAGVRSMLIRPDGYLAWAAGTDDPPPFAAWLGSA